MPVPSMGDSISEGTVVQWTKEAGESVEVDEVVVVLETDKVGTQKLLQVQFYRVLSIFRVHYSECTIQSVLLRAY